MEERIHYTAIGIFVVVFLTALILIGFWLSEGLSQKSYDTYSVIMTESVSGLNENAPVKYNGVTVGFVSKMRINIADPQQVQLLLQIERGTPITTGTTAMLAPQGITGLAYIDLNGGPAGAPPLERQEGELYPTIKSAPSLLFRIDAIVTQINSDFDKISDAFSKIMSPENQQAFSKILKNTAMASEQFPELMRRLNSASDATAQAMRVTEKTSHQINEKTLTAANASLTEIELLSDQLLSLTQQLQQNPSMLIRGKTATPPGPGE